MSDVSEEWESEATQLCENKHLKLRLQNVLTSKCFVLFKKRIEKNLKKKLYLINSASCDIKRS
jgi:hypothetical protein